MGVTEWGLYSPQEGKKGPGKLHREEMSQLSIKKWAFVKQVGLTGVTSEAEGQLESQESGSSQGTGCHVGGP